MIIATTPSTLHTVLGNCWTDMKYLHMFRNPFGRVRSSCSARRFWPENWTERHELSRASLSNRWHQRWLAYRSRWCCVQKSPPIPAIDQIKSLALWSKLWSKPNEVNPQTKKSNDFWREIVGFMVRVARIELTASWTPFKRATKTALHPVIIRYFPTEAPATWDIILG